MLDLTLGPSRTKNLFRPEGSNLLLVAIITSAFVILTNMASPTLFGGLYRTSYNFPSRELRSTFALR